MISFHLFTVGRDPFHIKFPSFLLITFHIPHITPNSILPLLIHPIPDTLPNIKKKKDPEHIRLLGELLLPEDNPTGGSQGTSLKFFGIYSQFLKGGVEVQQLQVCVGPGWD